MTRLIVEMELDNAAFADGNSGREASRILTRLAETIQYHDITAAAGITGPVYQLMDYNGNRVGIARVTKLKRQQRMGKSV